jgi:hypothetical protein
MTDVLVYSPENHMDTMARESKGTGVHLGLGYDSRPL